MAAQTDRGIPLSTISQKYLHTNSTSHTWPFSAIAELIDNAYDPDVSAKQFWIDKTQIKNVDCLTFVDNGNGLSYDKMHKMLSFGFSNKQDMKGHLAVGLYGNGFKSGSMRLGKDAIVLSKTKDAMCVGMLSQTYLEKTGVSHVVVPIVSFRCVGPDMLQPAPEHSASLQDILEYSLFQTKSELESELLAITGHGIMATTGTRIIIWNLKKTKTREMEFDFDKDRYDIRIRHTPTDRDHHDTRIPPTVFDTDQSATSSFSLRAYCTILYLKPRMNIILRGQKVKNKLVSKNLALRQKDSYKPHFLTKPVGITFGYNPKSKDHYGIMMYHRNRLIKAYHRVGRQPKGIGVGIIGVIECNFLKPTHNKQDFDYTDEYRMTISNIAVKLEEYRKEILHRRTQKYPNCPDPLEDIMMERPDQNWAQCDECMKFRKLPDGIDPDKLPDKWFCKMNPDPLYRSCEVPEEEEDSDGEATYTKTYKQEERYRKIQAERKRLEMEEERKKREMEMQERLAKLEMENKMRDDRCNRRSDMAQATTSDSNVLSQTEHVSDLTDLSRSSEGRPSTPSSTPNTATPRVKRKGSTGLDGAEAKQARYGHSPGSEAAIASPPAREAIYIDNKHDSDDDVIIDEIKSTPKPKAPTFDLSRVKMEQTSDVKCSDVTIPEVPRARTSPATPTGGALSPDQVELSTAIQAETSAAIKEKNEEVKSTVHDTEESGTKDVNVESMEVGVSQAQDRDEGTVVVVHLQEPSPVNNEEALRGGEEGKVPSPVNNVLLAEAQQQQDQMMEKMALERDSYQTEVRQLIAKVKDLEQNVLEPTQNSVRKEQNHQTCQADYPEGEEDYKSLQQQIEQLQKERDVLAEEKRQWGEKSKGEGNSSGSPQKQQNGGEASFSAQVNTVENEPVLQVDQCNRELDQCNVERDELKTKLASLEVERAALVSQMEQMQKELEEDVLEFTQNSVKKEQNHQACQADYPEGEGDYKSLQQQIEQLQKERDVLAEEKRQWEEKSKGEGNSSGSPQKEQNGGEASFSAQVNAVDDELALQVDLLFRELDQCNVERDELKTKLASLEVERAALVSQMEQMQKELEELKEAAMGSGHEEAGVDAASQTHGSPEPHGKETKHRENQHIAAPQRSCESCTDVPDFSHWILVKPQVSTEKNISTYSLSSPAGSYECSESGLRWSCAWPVTLQYRFMDWHLLADELPHMQYRPAGPSMDIKFISGELEEIHLPHFLCLGGTQSYLKDAVKVLQKGESGVFLETCELSRFHARLLNPSFSLFGVFYSLKSLMVPRKEKEREKQIEIHADVQMYLSSTSPLTFRIYLLPLDAHLRQLLEDQEKGFKGRKLAKPRPGRPLQMHENYPLKVDCETVGGPTPEELDLRESLEIAPNFSEVRISEAADFKMELLSPVDKQKVWQVHIWSFECSLALGHSHSDGKKCHPASG